MTHSSDTTLSIRQTTRGTLPRVPFLAMKNRIVGKDYELSLAFVGPTLSRKYNKTLRGKDKSTNILSFPLSKKSGEILIDLKRTYKDAPSFDMPPKKFLIFLFIHGLLHLKGYAHGSTMERQEKRYLREFAS